ncbi:MAG TPA: amidohydrolase family protein [Euzebyales bacterium]|nr:amidohydrolase family protein [Euzebyales bacterium]
MTIHDLVVRDARLRRGATQPLAGDVRSIGIAGGHIATIAEARLDGKEVIDAGGSLVTPSFVDAHLHLDKVHTWDLTGGHARLAYAGGDMGAAATAIELASQVKDDYDEVTISGRARGVLRDGLAHGVTHVRAFADTDTRAGLRGVRPLLALRDDLRGVIDLDVVAFPQDGIVRDPGAIDVVDEALRLGADTVGGIPWIEDTERDAQAHIDQIFNLAQRHGRAIAMLTDDAGDPDLRTTAMLASTALDRGWEGRVTACHARAIGLHPRPRVERLIRLARRAGMAFVTNPHTAPLALPVALLLDAGLPVALGQDDVADAYYPFGQHNLLEVGLLAAHALDMTSPADMERVLDMITLHPRTALGLDADALAVGAAADLVVLDGSDARQVLARHSAPHHVVRAGRPVAATVTTSDVDVPEPTRVATTGRRPG